METKNLVVEPETPGNKLYTFAYLEDPNLGARKTMEDFTIVQPTLTPDHAWGLFVILDGHGGSHIAEETKRIYPNILKTLLLAHKEQQDILSLINESINQLLDKLRQTKDMDCGSTFCGLLINSVTKTYYSINIGDSSLISVRAIEGPEGPANLEAVALTEEHKVTNPQEKERIKAANGLMNNRVGGQLLVTRAIGDFAFGSYGLTATPDIREHALGREKFLFVGSDGVWDAVNHEQLVDMLKANGHKSVAEITKELVDDAKTKSIDNISLIVLKF